MCTLKVWMYKSSNKYWSVCVLTYLIDQSSFVVDFLQLSPDTDLKNDPIAILVLSCVVISQYKALYLPPPLFFSKFDFDYNTLGACQAKNS